MWEKYRILSYIPAFGLSIDQLQHQWVCWKIYNFLMRKVLLQHTMARKIVLAQKNLHKKTEFHYYGEGLFVSVEYVPNLFHFMFKVKSFIAVYE